jgi:hypothetical protein
MRSRILLFTMLLAGFNLAAQFKKGDKMVGATVGSFVFHSGSGEIVVDQVGDATSKVTEYNFNFTPSLGWFISEHTVAGAAVTINPFGNKSTFENNGTTYQSDKSNTFNAGLGGFVRHYFKGGNTLRPFAQAGINFGISNLKAEGFFYGGAGTSAYKTSYDGHSTGGFFINSAITGGFTKMVGEYTGLDFYIGYTYSYNKNEFRKTTLRDDGINGSIDERGENTTTTKFSNHGVIVGVGFQVFLQKKK